MIKIYAIKDDKAQTWQGCYPYPNDAMAIRDFDQLFKQGKLGLINNYPEDFKLYCLGTYDETTGKIAGDLAFIRNFSDLGGAEDGGK